METLRKSLRMIAYMLAGILAFGCSAGAQTSSVRSDLLVSSQWLAQHLNDPKVVVLHVAEKKSDYQRGHIPGARYLNTDDFSVGDVADLPPPERIKEIFEKLGVSDDTRVVIYTTAWFPMAGRAFYTLDYFGHGDKTSLLDGGIEHWVAEKRPVSQETPAITPGHLTPRVHENVRAVLAEAKQATEPANKSVTLVDARPDRRYKAGHLAGAVPVYWQETLLDPNDDPVFLSPEKLRALFESRGIKPGQKLITYCEIGLQASHMYFVARYLGYDAAMFDGSIHEWSMVNNLPLVKGDSPR